VFEAVTSLLPGDMVRRSIDQTRTIEHASRISEPNRVPIRFDFARAGERLLAPSSNCSKEGGFRKSVLRGFVGSSFSLRGFDSGFR
jgi:hypothetical protein